MAYSVPNGQESWEFIPTASQTYWDVSVPGAVDALAASPVKVIRRLHWRAKDQPPPGNVLGVYIFTRHAMGPPGRAHGGAVATAFDDAMGQVCVREVGFLPACNTTKLCVQYL